MKKYLLILMSFFMVILGITSFSNVENEKVPNELIINNPKKEVTTIESLKNREHGEMNISVTKINPIPITGIERDGKLEFELPEKVELEENIFVTDDVNKIQEHRTLKLNKNLTTFSLENQTEKTKLKVDKPSDSKKIYIAVKEQDKIKRVYENTYMNYNSIDIGSAYIYLDGRLHFGNLYDSNFNKVSSGELYIGKDGKGRDKSRNKTFNLTAPLNNSVHIDKVTYGTIQETSFYISSLNQTLSSGDYFYNQNGLVLKKSNSLKYMAEGRDVTSNNLFNEVPAVKIPQRYYSFSESDKFVVGAKHTDNQDYHYTTYIKHAGDDISKFTQDITIDMTQTQVGGLFYLDSYFDWSKGARDFRTCLYTQVNSEQIAPNNIATIMRVKEQNGETKNTPDSNPALYPVFEVEFKDKYIFNYSQKWDDRYGNDLHFYIKKLGENIGTKKYTVEVYSGRDYHILLGVLNLTIKNGVAPEPPAPPTPPTPPAPVAPINIGSATFNIDRRFINRWIYGNEKTSGSLNNLGESYSELAKVDKFNASVGSIQITDIKVDNKSYYKIQDARGIRYKIFTTSWGEIAIPMNVNFFTLNENIAIYSNGRISNDEILGIQLVGSDNNRYVGNIKIRFSGEGIKTTKTTLNLSKWGINQLGIWGNPKNLQTTEGQGANLVGETLFYWKSNFETNRHVLTRLKITEGNNHPFEVTKSLPNQKLEIDFTNNRIGVDQKGFFIYKKTRLSQPITYVIEGYYKDVKLGQTTITITNENKPIEIGTAKFQIDKRLESLYKAGSGRWLFANGDLATGLNVNQFIKNYERFVNVIGFNSLSQNIQINDGQIENKTSDSKEYIYKKNFHYKAFKNNSWENAAAIPKVRFSQLNEALVIHKTNTNNIDKITMLGSDNNKYLGILQQEFIGESAKTTEISLDLSEWSIGQQESWSYPKKIDSTANNGKKANLVGGTFFHWRSYVKTNAHIIAKLKIRENNGTPIEINNTNNKLEHKFINNTIGIDKTGLYIKKENDSSQPVTYIIEGYYEDILLGKTTLTITNQKKSFELVGDGVLDFGNMVYTSNFNEYKKEKLFKVKNPSNAKLKFSVASSIGNIQNGKDNLKLENIKISESKNSKKGESSFVLSASTRLEKGTKPGKYTGEIQVIVDIDGTGK